MGTGCNYAVQGWVCGGGCALVNTVIRLWFHLSRRISLMKDLLSGCQNGLHFMKLAGVTRHKTAVSNDNHFTVSILSSHKGLL